MHRSPCCSLVPNQYEILVDRHPLNTDGEQSPDMWSIGLIAFILLSGEHPFFEPDTTKMFIRVAAGDYEFKPKEWGNISGEAQV